METLLWGNSIRATGPAHCDTGALQRHAVFPGAHPDSRRKSPQPVIQRSQQCHFYYHHPSSLIAKPQEAAGAGEVLGGFLKYLGFFFWDEESQEASVIGAMRKVKSEGKVPTDRWKQKKTHRNTVTLSLISKKRRNTRYTGSLQSWDRLTSVQWDCWSLGGSYFESLRIHLVKF